MVSKLYTHRSLLLSALLCYTVSLYSKSVEEDFLMKTFQNGTLFFLLPYTIPSITPNYKSLEADITYLTTSDSITMNISLWASSVLNVDSFSVKGDTSITLPNFQTFFIDKDGKNWLHRYSLRFALSDYIQMYIQPEPFIIGAYSNMGIIEYGYPIRKWEKEQKRIMHILHIIETNKKNK